jgi:hypothetical protein
MSPPTPEVTALLTCIRFHFGTVSEDEVNAALVAITDWSRLINLAIKHGVVPLFYLSLKPFTSQIPQSFMQQWQIYNRLNGLHNISQTRELLKCLAALQNEGIEAIPFKGAVLAASAYGNVALRQFNDLDLLVKKQDFWQARSVLVSQGYSPYHTPSFELEMFHRHLQISLINRTTEATLFNQQFQSLPLHSNAERNIDLHWGIPPRRVWKSIYYNQLWQDLDEVELMRQKVKTFSPEVTLVIQCINVTKEPWQPSFKQICDVAQIINVYPNLDWNNALELSASIRSQQLFLSGLQITRKLLGISLPQLILEKQVKCVLNENHVFGTEHIPKGELPAIWYDYINLLNKIDRFGDAIFITGFHTLIAFLTLFRITDDDREFLPLPKLLMFLYYPIRLFRLLMKYVLNTFQLLFTRKSRAID